MSIIVIDSKEEPLREDLTAVITAYADGAKQPIENIVINLVHTLEDIKAAADQCVDAHSIIIVDAPLSLVSHLAHKEGKFDAAPVIVANLVDGYYRLCSVMSDAYNKNGLLG